VQKFEIIEWALEGTTEKVNRREYFKCKEYCFSAFVNVQSFVKIKKDLFFLILAKFTVVILHNFAWKD
jgi:hypothetical protein